MRSKQDQYQKMTATPIPRLVLTLAAPTVVSMLVTAIYNMADTYFVSQLGTSASGAVGIVFSIMAVIQAVGFTLGMGAGSLVSRSLGAQDTDAASRYAATAFYTAIAFGLGLTVLGRLWMDPLMNLLGATPTILPFARDYAFYILLAAPVMAASFVMNNLLRAEGKAAFSMVGLTLGGVLNMLLDPLFIFGLGLGIAGAALATGLSQCVSFCILLSFFLRGKAQTSLHPRHARGAARCLGPILKTGFPSFLRQGLGSVASVLLNKSAAVYGDAAVAAMAIVGRIFMLIFSVMLGIGQGFQPVCGYNYGAKKYGRVRQAYRFTLLAGELAMGILAAIGLAVAPWLVGLFRDDAAVIATGSFAVRCQCVALLFMPFATCTSMLFQSVGQSGRAMFVSCLRQGLCFIPLITILPALWGLAGVQTAQALADLCTFLICIPFAAAFFRALPAEPGEAGAAPEG